MNSITGAILILAGVVAGAGRMDLVGLVLGAVGFIYLFMGTWKQVSTAIPSGGQPEEPA